MNKISLVIVCLIFAVFTAVNAAHADAPTVKDVAEKTISQEDVEGIKDEPAAGPFDKYGRSTPRSSLLALADAVRNKDYEKAAHYLDLRYLHFADKENVDGAELVRKLSIVARRAMKIDVDTLSDDPMGAKDDGLPSYRDRITTLDTKEGAVDILMQRVPRGDGVYIWKISNATVSQIPKLYQEFGYGQIGDRLSVLFPDYVILGFELWQLVMLLGLLLAGYIIATVLTYLVITILKKTRDYNIERLKRFITGPLRLLITVVIFRATFDMISPSLLARAMFEARTFLIIAMVWISFGFVDLVKHWIADRMHRNGQEDAIVLLKPANTAIKIILLIIGLLSWMDNLGYQVTTLLAGLGVGGVAVALAAQKSMENLIGSIMIYSSQPVRVGDFCRFGNDIGAVEEIGLRSTQLRTLARSVIHIPNAMFASGAIENLTQRDKILYRGRIRLSFETPAKTIQQVLEDIRTLFAEHEYVDAENSRIRFIEFGSYAHELEMFVYIKTQEFPVYLEQVEDLNLKISTLLDSLQVKLVVPVSRMQISSDSDAAPELQS